jgi:hypothetical protein
VILAVALGVAHACDDVATESRAARDLLLAMENEAAGRTLARARAALACDRVDADDLAVLYLVEAAFRTFGGDEAGARPLFAAAARLAPEVWLVDLGDPLLDVYRSAKSDPVPAGRLELVGVPADAEVWVDGAPATEAALTGGGIRTVQVVRGGEVVFGTSRLVEGTVTLRVPGAAPASAPAPVPGPAGPERLALHVALGGELALGERVEVDAVGVEPATRFAVPLELGARLRTGPVWWRPSLGVGQVLGSRLLYARDEEVRSTTTLVTAALAVGGAFGPLDLGVQAGVWLPGRQSARVVAAVPVAGPVAAELRLGGHLVPGRGVEGVGSVWLVLAPTLVGGR